MSASQAEYAGSIPVPRCDTTIMNKLKIVYLNLFLAFFITACASLETESEYSTYTPHVEYPEPEIRGVYHKVKRGETLWRIASTYDVSIDDIIRSNNIPNAAKVSENQLVLIPVLVS